MITGVQWNNTDLTVALSRTDGHTQANREQRHTKKKFMHAHIAHVKAHSARLVPWHVSARAHVQTQRKRKHRGGAQKKM